MYTNHTRGSWRGEGWGWLGVGRGGAGGPSDLHSVGGLRSTRRRGTSEQKHIVVLALAAPLVVFAAGQHKQPSRSGSGGGGMGRVREGRGGEGHPLVKNKQRRLLDPITPVWSNERGGLNTGC